MSDAPAGTSANPEPQETDPQPTTNEEKPLQPASTTDKPAADKPAQGDRGSNRLPQGAHHTIALLQPSKHDSTRFYNDFPSMVDAVEGVIRMFETRLKEYNPGSQTISYDFNSLCQYLDDMREVCLLSWDSSIGGYKRYDRAWLKAALQDHLTNLASQAARR